MPLPPGTSRLDSPAMVIVLCCAAHVATMVGVFAFPALLPSFQADWALSNAEAGWISGVMFLGYALGAPFLIGLTDRVDARRVYVLSAVGGGLAALLFALAAEGFWSAVALRLLAGVALAGTYMPGLRVMVDRLPDSRRGRAVPLYTASFSLGSASSYGLAGAVGQWLGWPWAFALAGAAGLLAAGALAVLPPHRPPPPEGGRHGALLDYRPVLRNRAAMGYILGYATHMVELFAFRAWVVAFLGAALATGSVTGAPAATPWFPPAAVATLGAVIAMGTSILGAEVALRFGRPRVVKGYMAASAAIGLAFGFSGGLPYPLVAGLAVLYAGLIQLDSAALTAGAVDAAEHGRRGLTLALHSLLGFGAAFAGPLIFGIVLDLAGGGEGPDAAWGLAFAVIASIALCGPLALGLAGHRRRHDPESSP